jgi:hypothetical protein
MGRTVERPGGIDDFTIAVYESAASIRPRTYSAAVGGAGFPNAENLEKTDKRRGAVTDNLGTIRGR